MSSVKIAFAVSADYPLLDDDLLIVKELEKQNVTVVPAIWDDPLVNWNEFPIVVIRSPWDYFLKTCAYQEWLQSFIDSNARLLNPPKTVLQNIDKRYLLDFEQSGIPIIPTKLIEQNESVNLHDLMQDRNWDEVVIKPTVSAGAWDTWRSNLKSSENDQEKFLAQVKKHAVLVQPFVPEIQSEGEWSIIYIDGKYSHSVLKKAKTGDYRIQEEHGGTTIAVEPSEEVLRQTQMIIDTQSENLLYARVDGIVRNGKFLLMELEINEPSLFFAFSPSSVVRFAQSVKSSL